MSKAVWVLEESGDFDCDYFDEFELYENEEDALKSFKEKVADYTSDWNIESVDIDEDHDWSACAGSDFVEIVVYKKEVK